ncbi:acetylornithine deacetylase/succinyl-diaminopimelate desuccinylase-like protein [Nonomuraea thailandensis]|uniref:Acetylornithine deacetylase/succinyl-diaminopimelate desuccinylase-like protein n=1 Tax=Nonomuraea thailandensis TaxID=1188745 RepID=A0A9X2GKA4_9ACTN|nr:M20/M25/M40 family metallo-hydrolase [Nonomuraea thailandensis]MCP2359217.1 acetylornithine deacetylase/succinyl-diaminopimelate desuccinylase-like protein [Nonomuraea thailandensis]
MKSVAEICSDLIRFDTTNPGSGERPAAEYVATLLADAGLEPVVFESAPKRTTVVARMDGDSPDALLVHGHLDVVPADPAEWRMHPFSGEIEDGCVYGRGAVDMKGSCAMTLATVLGMRARGERPRRDLVLAFLADEEATGDYGSRHAVMEHRELFDGVSEAISESGGFSVDSQGHRVYPIAVGERGTAWMKLTAHGVAGHGSRPAVDNPVATLVHALSRVAAYQWPVRLTPTVAALVQSLSEITGQPIDLDRLDAEAARLGPLGSLFKSQIRNSANPTMLDAGYKVNVVPSTASAHVDGRFMPGMQEEFLSTIDELLGPKVTREFVNLEDAPDAPYPSAFFDELAGALVAEDGMARPVPYVMAGGTDAKSFARIGIKGYGFAPLMLRPDLDYFGMFHGKDERVPVEGLEFGTRVLTRLFA